MADLDERIKELIGELDTEAHERVKRRAREGATSPEREKVDVSATTPDDVVTSALQKVEASVNAVRRARGEAQVEIVGDTDIDESQRAELERLIAEEKLDPVAVTATLGVRLRQLGRSDEALDLLEAAAESGDAMAAQTLALILEERLDTEKALAWQRFAAERGDHLAAYNLGRMLNQRGETDEAREWLGRSDDPQAASLLQEIASEGG
jgi:TPR repeat protein